MKTKLCALLVCVMTFCTGMAVPAAVEEHGGSIIKTYELAPEESPQLLIEEPFERDGFLYEYDGMTQEPVSNTESKSVSQTVTVESGNAKTEENLVLLAGSIPYEADGYTGTLTLLPPPSIRRQRAMRPAPTRYRTPGPTPTSPTTIRRSSRRPWRKTV